MLNMFRDLFLGDTSFSFDIGNFIGTKSDDGDYKYAWFFASLLKTKHLVSLSNLLELKKQLVIYVETDVVPSLINGDKQMLIRLCKELSDKAQSAVDRNSQNSNLLSLQYLSEKLVDPGEEFPIEMKPVLKIAEFEEVFQIMSKDAC